MKYIQCLYGKPQYTIKLVHFQLQTSSYYQNDDCYFILLLYFSKTEEERNHCQATILELEETTRHLEEDNFRLRRHIEFIEWKHEKQEKTLKLMNLRKIIE